MGTFPSQQQFCIVAYLIKSIGDVPFTTTYIFVACQVLMRSLLWIFSSSNASVLVWKRKKKKERLRYFADTFGLFCIPFEPLQGKTGPIKACPKCWLLTRFFFPRRFTLLSRLEARLMESQLSNGETLKTCASGCGGPWLAALLVREFYVPFALTGKKKN